MRHTLEGRHAVVTGASRGIGAAIVESLAARGARVTMMARSLDTLRSRADALRAASADVATIACDVSDELSVARAFAEARAEQGDVHILVNNAGMAEAEPFEEATRDLWDRTLALNLTGPFLCAREVVPAMIAARDGRIVNIASVAGLKGYATLGAYCASKHGLVGLTRSLAIEVAKHGVTVNAVCPGYTETEMAAAAIANVMRDRGVSEDEARAKLTRPIPRGKLTLPREVAETVAWLCEPGAAAITGVALPVSGGEL